MDLEVGIKEQRAMKDTLLLLTGLTAHHEAVLVTGDAVGLASLLHVPRARHKCHVLGTNRTFRIRTDNVLAKQELGRDPLVVPLTIKHALLGRETPFDPWVVAALEFVVLQLFFLEL